MNMSLSLAPATDIDSHENKMWIDRNATGVQKIDKHIRRYAKEISTPPPYTNKRHETDIRETIYRDTRKTTLTSLIVTQGIQTHSQKQRW